MQSKKQNRILIIVPCYKRPEYTRQCIKALEEAQKYKDCLFCLVDDGSKDGTAEILKDAKFDKYVIVHKNTIGLRNTIIEFFKNVGDVKYIAKIDNDCTVPKNWLKDMLSIFRESPVQILSPNVYPSNAAFVYGKPDMVGFGYRPAKIVGGLWMMYADMLEDIDFEKHRTQGIKGAFNLLKQIIIEKDPIVGWVHNIIVQDIGHYSGKHPDHIKTTEHELYYQEVGRNVAWT